MGYFCKQCAQIRNNINSLIATKLRIEFNRVVGTPASCQTDSPQQLRSDTCEIHIHNKKLQQSDIPEDDRNK